MKALNIIDHWAEYLAVIFLVVGFFIALISQSAVVTYAMVFVCGAAAGRVLYRAKDDTKVPTFVMIIGFLIGFLLGSFYGDKKLLILFYIIGIFVCYYVHDQGYIKSREV